MSKPLAILVPALQGKDPHATAAQIFKDLGWQRLDRSPPRSPSASPSALPPVETTFLLAHPAYGIALVDIVPDCAFDPVEHLQRRLRLVGFATASLPILHFSLTAEDVWRIPTIIDPAFALQAPMEPPAPGWIDRVQEALLLAPPEPAPLPLAAAEPPTAAPLPALTPTIAPPALPSLPPRLAQPSAPPAPQRRNLSPVWVLLAAGLLSGGAMLQFGRVEADGSSAPAFSASWATATGPSTPAPSMRAEALPVLPLENVLAAIEAPWEAPWEAPLNSQPAPLPVGEAPRPDLTVPSRETEAAAAQPPAAEIAALEPLPEADPVLVDLFQPPAERRAAAPARQPVEEPVAPPPAPSLAAAIEVAPALAAPTETAPVQEMPVLAAPIEVAPAAPFMEERPVEQPIAWLPSVAASAPGPSAPVAAIPVPSALVSSAPVAAAPVASAPVASAPVPSAPVAAAPVASAPVPSAPATPAPQPATATATATAPAALDPRVVNLLVARGNEMLARGDMSAARLLFARAAEAGSAAAALAMARSFDPAVLATLGVPGIRPDPAASEHWYRRAAELGAR